MDQETIASYEEADAELKSKLKDERLMADLLAQAKELYKIGYAKDIAKEKGKSKGRKLGFMLQNLFGKTKDDGSSIWLMKDLNAAQLLKIIALSENMIAKQEKKRAKEASSHSIDVNGNCNLGCC
jgi:hypothetical protein